MQASTLLFLFTLGLALLAAVHAQFGAFVEQEEYEPAKSSDSLMDGYWHNSALSAEQIRKLLELQQSQKFLAKHFLVKRRTNVDSLSTLHKMAAAKHFALTDDAEAARRMNSRA